jgi:hypothetical protein
MDRLDHFILRILLVGVIEETSKTAEKNVGIACVSTLVDPS